MGLERRERDRGEGEMTGGKGGGGECCWKTGGAARNRPNECIKEVSKGTTRLN